MNFTRFNVQKINTISTNVSTLLTRLSAARAGYLDNLNNANLLLIPDLSTLSAARIGYLDNIASSNLLTVPNMTNFPPAVQAYLNNANLQSIPSLVNFTSTRQVYVDAPITSRAAAATALDSSDISNLDAAVSSRAPSSTALSTGTWTAARAAHLDHLTKLIFTVEYILGTANKTIDLSGFGGTATLISAFVEASGWGAVSATVGHVEIDFFVDDSEVVSNQRVVNCGVIGMAAGNTLHFDVTAHLSMASQTCKVNWDLVGEHYAGGAKLVVTYSIT